MSMDFTWDDITVAKEQIDPEAVKKVEAGNAPLAGQYLVECIESSPLRSNWGKYTASQVLLKFQILGVKKIGKIEAEEGKYDYLKGRFLWDRITLYDPVEADGTKNRRHFVANRLGLLDNSSELTLKSWSEDVIGKQVLLTVIDNKYEKDGEVKENLKVPFSGYDRPSASMTASADPLKDL
jgi:hypothetical protein